ncbi:MAG: hypothetical protein GC179_15130 [Anaerolineaceae bacterium]|nr:hypothetical protein [Anaerolineaceae bacterium]
MTPSPVRQEQIRQHRRETLLYFIVPLLVTVFIVLLGIVVTLLLQRQLQVSILADWMAIVLVFCPALLCTTVVCILLVACIFLMNRASRAAVRPLQKVNELADTAADRTAKAAASINNTTVNIASRFAFLDRLLSIFDLPDEKTETRENHHD